MKKRNNMANSKWTRRRFCAITSAAATIVSAGPWLACDAHLIDPAHEKSRTSIGSGENDSPLYLFESAMNKIPKRVLGKTDLHVSVLAFGGGSNFMKNPDGKWEAVMQKALDEGINYFDTSCDYSGSEERYGAMLSPIREQVIITTKINGYKNDRRSVDVMMRELETSLKKLKTNYLDILLIHSIENNDTVSDISWLYQQMKVLKSQGVIKYMGFSSMNSAYKGAELIKAMDFDVCMLAINPTTYGDFENITVPEAIKKNMGVLAMKVMLDVVNKNGVTPQDLMHWALDRNGVAGAVIAHTGLQVLEENAAIAKQFNPSLVVKRSWRDLEEKLKPLAGPHALSWAMPGYRDSFQPDEI
jgi:uncharacterized protein